MGILAISEYIRHGKRNVFIVFQMAALLFVLCVSASTLLAEYRLYRPFAQLNHKEGLYLSASGYHGANPNAIAKGMEKVDYVLAIGTIISRIWQRGIGFRTNLWRKTVCRLWFLKTHTDGKKVLGYRLIMEMSRESRIQFP